VTGSVPQATNLAARFVLELCMLAALGYVGFQLGDGLATEIGLAVALPLAAAIVWGIAIAPKARRRAPDPGRAVLELVVFAAAAFGLIATGQGVLGLLLAVAVVVNIGLMFAWEQRRTA
jgi:cytochrome b